jgi:hypothetical protein
VSSFSFFCRAAAALMMGEDMHKFARSRLDRNDLINPASRQIYLTFPADSTFREEDVSNYFRFIFSTWFILLFLVFCKMNISESFLA